MILVNAVDFDFMVNGFKKITCKTRKKGFQIVWQNQDVVNKSTVYDVGPMLNRHWFNVLCLLGIFVAWYKRTTWARRCNNTILCDFVWTTANEKRWMTQSTCQTYNPLKAKTSKNNLTHFKFSKYYLQNEVSSNIAYKRHDSYFKKCYVKS